VTTLAARDGYRLWAPSYDAETAVSHLEDVLVRGLGIATRGVRLLDVGCGTARRVRETDAALAVGVDVTPEMLVRARVLGAGCIAAADGCALPFARGAFDVVWCRLMIGHVSDVEPVLAELARVCRRGGAVVVTDIAAAAAAAGHRRTFRDAGGVTRELEHFVHAHELVDAFAHACGLDLEMRREGVVGPAIRAFYEAAGRRAAYDAQLGQPLVSVAAYRTRAD